MKQLTFLACAFILGISLVTSAIIFRSTFSNSVNGVNHSQITMYTNPDLMTKKQLAEYLQISEESVENIIMKDDFEKAKFSEYDIYRFIPYVKIDNQERFLKSEIDKWLKYQNDGDE